MDKTKLTKSFIDSIETPSDNRRVVYWDSELKGFCVRVSREKKIYYAVKRANRKLQWVKIGSHGLLNPDQARKEALKILADVNKGIMVNREKALARTKGITLEQICEMYIDARPNLRSSTIESYKTAISNHLKTWLTKPMVEISSEMVSRRHLVIASSSGEAQANKVMRVLRLLFNYLSVVMNKSIDNPVKRLSDTRQWFRVERRQTLIKEHQLRNWYDAVINFSNPAAADALLLLLFTGCREKEILTLRWEDVDIRGRTFTIRAEIAKNHKEHTLPTSSVISEIFKKRSELMINEWVFPGPGEQGHLRELRRAVEYVIKQSKVTFCLHDLRRTFTSLAEQEVSYAVLKRLLNHYTGNDVTAGYLVIPVEQLRLPMQKVSDRIMKAIKTKGKG